MATVAAPLLVVGSLNIDYIASVSTLPAPGETVTASGLVRRFGGKGANQAVAAARQGTRVRMIGCIGDDDEGRAYRKRLKVEGIDVSGIVSTTKASTGTALIAVDERGENTIIVAAGANGHLTTNVLTSLKHRVTLAGVILLQFEVPMNTTMAAVRLANQAGVPVVLNPSPFRSGFAWGACRVDTLIVNSGEASAVFGLPQESITSSRDSWVKALAKAKVSELIITRGARPTVFLSAQDFLEVPTLLVKPRDTVGAGDAFAGAFAARRAEGLELIASIRLANCAGALTTLKPGAQEAIPTLAVTEAALRRLPSGHSNTVPR
jgi:ribokinase